MVIQKFQRSHKIISSNSFYKSCKVIKVFRYIKSGSSKISMKL